MNSTSSAARPMPGFFLEREQKGEAANKGELCTRFGTATNDEAKAEVMARYFVHAF